MNQVLDRERGAAPVALVRDEAALLAALESWRPSRVLSLANISTPCAPTFFAAISRARADSKS